MKKTLLTALMMLCLMMLPALADTLYAGPSDSGLMSITEALSMAQPGDEIVLADGIYDQTREIFPIAVDKAVTLQAAGDAVPVIVSPKQTTAMEITGQGAAVKGVHFDHIRCAVWVLADNVTVENCTVTLTDEAWRTSSSGMWIGGAKNATVRGNTFIGCGLSLAGPPVNGFVDDVAVLTAMFEVGEDLAFFNTHTIENNTVNGKQLCYLVGAQDAVWTEEAGQVIAVQCRNMSFENLNLDFGSIGIQLAYCDRVTVDQCSASDCGIFGVYVMKSQDCILRRTRTDRCAHGVDIRDSDRIIALECTAYESGQGIFFSWARNSLAQRCEMKNNGVGFFTASGSGNHVDDCLIESNELGLYVQKEPLFTITGTTVKQNSVCGMRVTKTGIICTENTFIQNFVGHLALDCTPLLYMNCTWTGNQDCDMFVRGGSMIKLLHNTFDGPMEETCRFSESENCVYTE